MPVQRLFLQFEIVQLHIQQYQYLPRIFSVPTQGRLAVPKRSLRMIQRDCGSEQIFKFLVLTWPRATTKCTHFTHRPSRQHATMRPLQHQFHQNNSWCNCAIIIATCIYFVRGPPLANNIWSGWPQSRNENEHSASGGLYKNSLPDDNPHSRLQPHSLLINS